MNFLRYFALFAAAFAFGTTFVYAQTYQLQTTIVEPDSSATENDESKEDEDSSTWIRVQQIDAVDSGEEEVTTSPENAETEDKDHKEENDILSTSPTDTEAQRNESDLDFLSRPADSKGETKAGDEGDLDRPVIRGQVPATATGVYLKLGDINGESKDSSSDNSSLSLGANESIEVKGVEVRGWDPETKKNVEDTAPKDAAEIETENDLALFVAAHASKDTHMENVAFYYNKIEWEYKSSGRLFGVIPLTFTSHIETNFAGTEGEEIQPDKYGRVKVQFPWYRFLMRTDVSRVELEEELNAALEGEEAGAQVAPSQTKVLLLAQAFQTVSNILKAKHDTE